MNLASTYNSSQPVRLIRPLEDFSEPAIEAWISQLPLTDVDGASEALYGLLRKVNMTDGLDCLERQRIVEQIRQPTVSLLGMGSEKHLPASTLFPLSAIQHRHTQRSVEMCLELASAYRRIVTSGTFFSAKVMTDATRAQTVYRALQSYGWALLRSLERYESPPDGFWREIYAFYLFAEGHRLHTVSLPMPEIDGATVDSQFKQILLMALASHQHYLPDEIRQFYIALMLIAGDAEIADSQELDEEAALFYFDIGTDKAPRQIKRAKPLRRGQRRFMFAAKMLGHARQYFSNPAHRATDRFKLRFEVIMSLLETLAASEKRRFVRMPAEGNRQFLVGLPRLIDGLSGKSPVFFPEPLVDKLPAPSLPVTDDDEMEEMEIVLGQRQEAGGDAIWLQGGYPGSADSADYLGVAESMSAADSVLTGSLLNTSAGGYCMTWLNTLVAGARVGEVIGLYEDEQTIHVGVIRWLHQKTKAELVIGVELLSPEVGPVSIQNTVEGRGPQQALYLLANEKLGQPASLLCGPGTLKVGQNIVLRGKTGDQHLFSLEKALEATLSYQLFSLVSPDSGAA